VPPQETKIPRTAQEISFFVELRMLYQISTANEENSQVKNNNEELLKATHVVCSISQKPHDLERRRIHEV